MLQVDGTEALHRICSMRRASTKAERMMWHALRGRRLAGFCRRQAWIGPDIADFLCLEAELVVELDGGQHADQVAYDEKRSAFLATRGLRVLRIWNNDVEQDHAAVLRAIEAALVSSPSRRPADGGPLPLPTGEGI